jgi:hypothetical protein
VRNARLGFWLFSIGALAWPVLALIVYTVTHWLTIRGSSPGSRDLLRILELAQVK